MQAPCGSEEGGKDEQLSAERQGLIAATVFSKWPGIRELRADADSSAVVVVASKLARRLVPERLFERSA